MTASHHPTARGLYDPRFEHDACGIGFVARLNGSPSHDVLSMALTALGNMEHRGAVAADGKSGDGAGVLTQLPLALIKRELATHNITVDTKHIAVAMLFLPRDATARASVHQLIIQHAKKHHLNVVHRRDVPINMAVLGERAAMACPVIEQVYIVPQAAVVDEQRYERTLYLLRRDVEAAVISSGIAGFYVPSLSHRTIVYKGLVTAHNLPEFYLDLRDPDYTSAVAVFHQRYSTNTFPTWERAQPFRMLSHNGEINTLDGNVMWMQAREAAWRASGWNGVEAVPVRSDLGTRLANTGHTIDTNGSDSSMLDNVLELTVMGGRDIRHSLAMLVPEAWERIKDMDPAWRAFYQYHSTIVEPWDGPAALAFCDGQVVGLSLDRNGLRPARFLVTNDGMVIVGSEVGAVTVDEAKIVRKGKVGPGQMIAADLRRGVFEENHAIKTSLAARRPYAEWLTQEMSVLAPASAARYGHISTPEVDKEAQAAQLGELQQAFGYTAEELSVVLRPMARDGQEPVGSMGDDTPLSIFADRPRPVYSYVKQRFAEVTNPPIDPLREDLVMSLATLLGARGHLLEETAQHAHLLRLAGPVLRNGHIETIRSHSDPSFSSTTIDATFSASAGPDALVKGIERVSQLACDAVRKGSKIVIISDRASNDRRAPIPALLAVGAVHRALVTAGLRRSVSVVVESGDMREVHHLACLIGMGAEAVNPWLALASVRALAVERQEVKGSKQAEASESSQQASPAELADEAEHHYVHALEKGLLKIMSKMGIATVDSYCGAQTFEVIGLSSDVTERCFVQVPTRLGGHNMRQLAAMVLEQHDAAFASRLPLVASRTTLANPGYYKFKKDGEYHAFSPAVVHALQKASNSDDYALYQTYSDLVQSRKSEIRDWLTMRPLGAPIAIDDVEPIEAIVPRFSTAAMSLGSTSAEAHETLAIAMNRLGGLSNSGEGGEGEERYDNERNSTIKQVASGRFGVTPGYLMSAKELQIKMAQGAKPGEGGQIPAAKVTDEIARTRHTMPGISLISPPPHHDIYSIEDLSQLIYDLKQVNPAADISVKLVAEAGVGTIAAGVAKGGAEVVHISGHSGGTGAAPLSSLKHAGVNWELGLAESQQTLVLNGLRGRIRVRIDGGIKTGRDVVLAALLGADEVSFGTAALVAEGCVMARTCHSNNCPVGVATQRPELRAKFSGTPEQVIHFLLHVAHEVREILASLGARSLNDIIGRTDLLSQIKRDHDDVSLARLIEYVAGPNDAIRYMGEPNTTVQMGNLNRTIMHDAAAAIAGGGPIELSYPIHNIDRTVTGTLSGAIAKRHGGKGLPAKHITIHLHGSAGQSLGAFLASGVAILLDGESNDYVGKGMSGGLIRIRPSREARYTWSDSSIIGNTCLYGATGGELYAAGRAGERFAVRNSGAVAVVEGAGDHACEYMTGGVVLILGETGRNVAAGMTGGVAYVYDTTGNFPMRFNGDMAESSRLRDIDDGIVLALIKRHLKETGSPRAQELLNNWANARGNFWAIRPKGLEDQVMPRVLDLVDTKVKAGM